MNWAHRKLGATHLIYVGHSAGGVLARLYLYEGPVWGHVYAGAEHATALLTLGSPHCSNPGSETGWFLSDEANRLAPGAPHADRIPCWAIAGRWTQGHQDGSYWQRRAFDMYRFFEGQGNVWGDGVVPVGCAVLDGAQTIIMDGIAHSRKYSRTWYGGSKTVIRRWWPERLSHAT